MQLQKDLFCVWLAVICVLKISHAYQCNSTSKTISSIDNICLENEACAAKYFNGVTVTVTPLYKHLGLHRIEDVVLREAVVMTKERHEEFCVASVTNQTSTLKQYYQDRVVFVSEDFSQSCQSRLGFFTKFEHLKFWCALDAIIVMTNNPHRPFNYFIGYYYNHHDGNRFKDKKRNFPVLTECRMYEAIYESQAELEFLSVVEKNGFPTNETPSDELFKVGVCAHDLDSLFDTFYLQFLFRGFLAACYLGIGIRCIQFIILDANNGYLLTRTHKLTLTINCCTMLVLGFFEALGAHYMFDTLGMRPQSIVYFLFFGTSVATDFLLSIMYQDVIRKLKGKKNGTAKGILLMQLFFLFAFILVCIDIVSGFFQYTTRQSVYNILYEDIPLTFTGVQLGVNIFLIFQTHSLVRFFRSSAKLSKQIRDQEKYAASKKLEKRFTFWVPVSVGSSMLGVIMWLLWYKEVLVKQQGHWALLWFCLSLSKIGNVLAQVQVCRPPERDKSTKVSEKKSNYTNGFSVHSKDNGPADEVKANGNGNKSNGKDLSEPEPEASKPESEQNGKGQIILS